MKIEDNNNGSLELQAQKYLGIENYRIVQTWYSCIGESKCDYVVFIVRRAYLLALIMEEIDGQRMESRGKRGALFLTDSSFYSRCHELAEKYRTDHRFPKILICEDALSHGRNINNFLECMENAIIMILRQTDSAYLDEDMVRLRFAQAVTIHVLAKAWEQLLILDRYAMRIRSCSTKNITELHDLSCRISTLISYSGLVNASYIFSESIDRIEFENCKKYGFTKTIYQNITEYAHIEYVRVADSIKAVFTLRIIPSQLNDGEYQVVPFVFLPNMGTEETDKFWRALRKILEQALGDDEDDDFLEYLDHLKELEGMRIFNEWITLILSQVLLYDFNRRFDIVVQDGKFVRQLFRLARNYNVTGLKKTSGYLLKILSCAYLSKKVMEYLITDCIKEEKEICRIGDQYCDSMQSMADKLEEYWYKAALNDEKNVRITLRRLYDESAEYLRRRVRGCGFTLKDLLSGYNENSINWGFAYFLQMMDAGIIGVSSYSARNIKVVGFSQFVKAGEMSLLLYPLRMMEYIPLLIEIHRFCEKLEWDWQEEVMEYCRSAYSQMDSQEINAIGEFIDILEESMQCPEEWGICYDNKVQYVKDGDEEKDGRTQQVKALLNLKVQSNRHLHNFDNYKNEVIFG